MAFMAIFLEFANSNCKKDKWRIHGFESLINPFLFLSNSSQFHFQSFSLHFRFRLYFFLIKNQYSFLFDFWCRMEQQDRPIYFIGSRALMIQPKPRKKSNKQTYSLVQLVHQDHFLKIVTWFVKNFLQVFNEASKLQLNVEQGRRKWWVERSEDEKYQYQVRRRVVTVEK